mgnify:CR=1 FL=1
MIGVDGAAVIGSKQSSESLLDGSAEDDSPDVGSPLMRRMNLDVGLCMGPAVDVIHVVHGRI